MSVFSLLFPTQEYEPKESYKNQFVLKSLLW